MQHLQLLDLIPACVHFGAIDGPAVRSTSPCIPNKLRLIPRGQTEPPNQHPVVPLWKTSFMKLVKSFIQTDSVVDLILLRFQRDVKRTIISQSINQQIVVMSPNVIEWLL